MRLSGRLAVMAVAAMAMIAQSAHGGEIRHAMGVTMVPDNPERVIVLTNEGTEAVLSLGVAPVGAANSWLGDPWYPHIAEMMAGVEPVGKENAINLELVAALEPDIILGNKQRHEKIYAQLSTIAPTILSERLRGDWKINYRLYAQALGKQGEGDAVMSEFGADVEALSEALGEARNEQVSVIRFLASQIRIYQKDSFSGVLLDRLGFARPPIQDVDDFALRVGKESIPDMDGDRIFHFTYDTGTGEGIAAAEEALADPLWRNLSAVAAGRVHAVDDAIWNTAGGVLAARLMLDDIARIYGVTYD